MKPFLLLQSRPEADAAKGEYEAITAFGGLTHDQLKTIHIDKVGVPQINLDEYSGVIVGGGPWNLSDSIDEKTPAQMKAEVELESLMDEIIRRDFPYLGICLGLGILVKHLGGEVSKDYMEPVYAPVIQLTEAGQTDPLFAHIPNEFQAFVGHHEGSKATPDGSVLLATTKMCPVQMIRVKNNIFATQFHPELDSERFIERLEIYKHHKYFEPHEFDGIKLMAKQVTITAPHELTRAFISRYLSKM